MPSLLDRFVKKPTLRICMLGPRAVGKTTVLTSIFADTQDNISDTGIFIRYKADTKTSMLVNYRNQLEHCIETRNAANLPATATMSEFNFELGHTGQVKMNLVIKDFPGEYITDRKKDVVSFVAEANVVIVAIDTPYLMEENGKYNNEKNKPELVKAFIKDNPAGFKNKLILFVPLKCERYFHDNRMNEVAVKVRESYGDLKGFFDGNNVASVITPILTLGGIELSGMKDNTTGMGDVAKIATYRMYEKNPKYIPLFCAQPMYYLLTYVSNYNEWLKDKPKSFVDAVLNTIFAIFDTDKDFKLGVDKMRKNIISDKFGFEIMTSNSILRL